MGSSLEFTPITLCWRKLNYYVTVSKHLTGESAENVMPEDHADKSIAGKKRLLHDITGVVFPAQYCAETLAFVGFMPGKRMKDALNCCMCVSTGIHTLLVRQ